MSTLCSTKFYVHLFIFLLVGTILKIHNLNMNVNLKFQLCFAYLYTSSFIHDNLRAHQGIILNLPTTFKMLMLQVLMVAPQ